MKKSSFILNSIICILTLTNCLPAPTPTPTPTPTTFIYGVPFPPPLQFTANVLQPGLCYNGPSEYYLKSVIVSANTIVDVLGKMSNNMDWLLIQTNGVECWMKSSLLDYSTVDLNGLLVFVSADTISSTPCYFGAGEDNAVQTNIPANLKVVIYAIDYLNGNWFSVIPHDSTQQCWVFRSFLTSFDSGTLPPANPSSGALTPVVATSTVQFSGDLKVDILLDTIVCECNGRYGTVHIKIFFLNGTPPFEISGQNPVNEPKAEFDVPLGSGDLNLILTSSDGLKWKGIVKIPTTCEPQADCGGQDPKPPEPPPTDTPEPPWCQFFPQLCD